jgi:glucose-1-phosphate cytidylyltransferase
VDGYGTFLLELIRDILKSKEEIGGFSIFFHIMQIYAAHGFNDFVVARSNKGSIIKNLLSFH